MATFSELNEKFRNDPSYQDEGYPDMVVTKSGKKPLDTYGNLKYLLDKNGISVKWNDMSRARIISIPRVKLFHDDLENSALREIINIATLAGMPIKSIDAHLDTISQQNHFHPIIDCIASKLWDGESRLDQFIKTVKTSNDELSYKLIRRWMISAIAAAFSESGAALQGALVLQGVQYVGKTKWVKSLEPTPCNAIKEGAILDPGNKDSIITLSRYWIVELGELDGTFKKSDIARIKSYITSQTDEVRFPYARKNTLLPRKTAFVATVNESSYLIDETGNRRWWTIPVKKIEFGHGLDMQQVWAEVYALWVKGEKINLAEDEMRMLNNLNEEHENIDPMEEKLLAIYDWESYGNDFIGEQLTATEVLEKLGYKMPTKGDAMRISKVLRKLTCQKPARIHGGKRVYSLPYLK